jgi:SecD/SecF fusion protein
VISVYIALRFEWKYAVPVLIALMHDLLITAGVYSLTGREVTASTVAALLTILGYSLYDTIIVFDRIRENVPRMPRAAFSQIVNRSMSEVLQRSLATSLCTALPILALLLFGGNTLKDFAFALLIGTISGAYSSIFIASPVLTHWKEREPNYEARAERIYGELGEVPAYATAIGGAPVDVVPKEPTRRRRGLSDQPEELSASEFQELVRDLPPDAVPQRTVTKPRPPKVQQKPPKEDGNGGGEDDRARDLSPDEVVMPKTEGGTQGPKGRRPRNKRHGRR